MTQEYDQHKRERTAEEKILAVMAFPFKMLYKLFIKPTFIVLGYILTGIGIILLGIYFSIYYPIASIGVIVVFLVNVVGGFFFGPLIKAIRKGNTELSPTEPMKPHTPKLAWLKKMFIYIHENNMMPLVLLSAIAQSV